KDAGRAGDQAHCVRCNEAYASAMHVEDLITVQRALGYRYEVTDKERGEVHYQRVCPKCRRAMLALAQGSVWADSRLRFLEARDREVPAGSKSPSTVIDMEGSMNGE